MQISGLKLIAKAASMYVRNGNNGDHLDLGSPNSPCAELLRRDQGPLDDVWPRFSYRDLMLPLCPSFTDEDATYETSDSQKLSQVPVGLVTGLA